MAPLWLFSSETGIVRDNYNLQGQKPKQCEFPFIVQRMMMLGGSTGLQNATKQILSSILAKSLQNESQRREEERRSSLNQL
jgi:hypothetical protein